MIIPTAENDENSTARVRKVNCYQSFLYRIRHRQYYTPSGPHHVNDVTTNTTSNNNNTFVIEIPCSEMIRYNPSLYHDFVEKRILQNVLRYQEIFCTVIDQLLSEIGRAHV